MDFIKGNEQIKIDPSGIDISGAGHITIDSEKIIGDICLNGDLSMNGNLEVYGGKIGIGKTPAYNYNLDIIGAINCTGGVYVDGSNVAGSGSGKPIVAKGMTVQIQHKDYNEKVIKVEQGWRAIDSREDGNGFVVKIKPTSIQSKVLVSTVVHIGQHTGYDSRWWGVRLYRKIGNGDWLEVTGAKGENDTTTLYSDGVSENYLPEPTISGTSVWFSNNQGMFVSGEVTGAISSYLIGNSTASYLDSPGTTEEVAYTLWWNSGMADPNVNRQLFLNRSQEMSDLNRLCTQSSLTATEIWDEPGAYIPTDAAIMVDGATDYVGIGTSTPATGVDIHRDLSLNGNIEISNNTFVITNEGWVGVGTSSPDFPLHVKKYKEGTGYTSGYTGGDINYEPDWFNTNGGVRNSGHGWGASAKWVSIKAESSILCTYLLTTSDRRIKTDISLVVDDTALNRVNALESKEYNYIDPERKRPMKTIGFIAQEVKEVVPNAVSLQTAFIPDEMRLITEPTWTQDASNNWLLDIPDLDMSGAFTGKAKFYVSNDPSGNDEVCKEVEIKEVDDSTPLFTKNKFVAEFDQSWNNVFFYGKEVSDFHTIDKNQIFALHHSAIQELSRRNDNLQEENNTKTNKIASLESRVEALEEAILAMQTLVVSLQNN